MDANLDHGAPKLKDKEVIHEIVADAYRALLKREPDVGINYHISKIKGGEQPNFRSLFEGMISSPEYERRILDHLCYVHHSVPKKVRHVVSLGTHCYTAFLIKYAGLKKASYPFDWIFSSQAMVRHCLGDDFEQFLRRDNLTSVAISERIQGPNYNKCNNLYYLKEFGVKFVFNHHDMSEEKSYKYFERAVSRFRTLMLSADQKLLLQCTHHSHDTLKLFNQTCEIIDTKSTNATLVVVAVSRDTSETPMPQLNLRHTNGNHELYHMNPVSDWQPLRFANLLDDLAILRVVEQQGLEIDRKYTRWATL